MMRMSDLDLADERVLIREDLNVPIKDGKIANDQRIRAALPTIQAAAQAGARVLVMSHLGRPKEGAFDAQYSLAPVAHHLSGLLNRAVRLERDWLNCVVVAPGEVVLCENVRFNVGEKANDETLSRAMAELCDVFVMDAFGCAHRAQASTHGVAKYAPVACAGPLLLAELTALSHALKDPARPLLAVVGGSKVSTKLTVLANLSQRVDQLIVGGGIANTFIAAAGHGVGQSLYEPDLVDEARRLLAAVEKKGAAIPVPVDVVVAREFSADAVATVKAVSEVAEDEMILDVGPQTSACFGRLIAAARTIVWNGPLGVFEFEAYARGTQALAQAIAHSDAFSIAGGGDTLAAIDQFGITDQVSYVSTGGGAFLEFLEGRELPAVAMLEQRGRVAHGPVA